MNSEERLDKLIKELESIKGISLRYEFENNRDNLEITVDFPYRVDTEGWLEDHNNELVLEVYKGYIYSICFSDGVVFGDPAPLIVNMDKQMKALVQVIDVVKKYFKEGN